jgi:hypothetical protein
MSKLHYHDAKPVKAQIDLPHLRDGGKWRSPDGLPKRRMESYLGWLKAVGISDIDAKCMMSDLYWDCAQELALNALHKANDKAAPYV